jgi:hypothetical protein
MIQSSDGSDAWFTVTDSRHSLFGQQFTVLSERLGRAPAFMVVELPDGRRRSIRIACTDLGREPPAADQNAADLSRVSVRTVMPSCVVNPPQPHRFFSSLKIFSASPRCNRGKFPGGGGVKI